MTGPVFSRLTWLCVAFLGIAGFFLVTEHAAHFFGVLPYLLLLASALLHLSSPGRQHPPGLVPESEGAP